MTDFRPRSMGPMNGTVVMREHVMNCPGLKFPERIHARKLRKYLATVCQVNLLAKVSGSMRCYNYM